MAGRIDLIAQKWCDGDCKTNSRRYGLLQTRPTDAFLEYTAICKTEAFTPLL